MDLQSYLMSKFESWQPTPPTVEGRTKRDVTLSWHTEPFNFLEGDLLFWVQRKEKMPPWVFVYSGGKNIKTIDNLEPRSPHKFRIKVILKDTAVPTLAKKALKVYGDEQTVFKRIEEYSEVKTDENNKSQKSNKEEVSHKDTKTNLNGDSSHNNGDGDATKEQIVETNIDKDMGSGDCISSNSIQVIDFNGSLKSETASNVRKCLESQWSEETWTSTDTDGSSAICFCMAVRCGYLKQMQVMLEERPALIEIINSNNGFTPLATAVRKGDINTVKFLLAAGADVNQPSTTGQTPLHLATLNARVPLIELLLDKGADFQARDLNGLRIEHYAVDSGSEETLTFVLQRGGDLAARDDKGWTPLFRAVIQGAPTSMIELLVQAGSDVDSADYSGLALTSAARLLTNRYGRVRDSVLRLVDSQYPHEKAVANFTRLTNKISSLHTILK